VLHRQPGLYVATAEGLRWCGLQRLGVYRVGAGGFVHAREVAATAVALERGFPTRPVLGEREIRVRERDAGRPLASAKLAESTTPSVRETWPCLRVGRHVRFTRAMLEERLPR
jgi:hypothetical protein